MKVLLFGATGMVGQGVLRECLLASDVSAVRAVGRTPTGQSHPKLSDLLCSNLTQCDAYSDQLQGYDACFFCLGVSSAGMDEQQYHHITYDLTLAAATTLAKLNPGMTFIYVSGVGTDSSEKGRVMWARVKGQTENALQRLPFKAVYLFRPGIIMPLDGIQSKTDSYRMLYSLGKPLLSAARALFPKAIATTRTIGQAMLQAASQGAPQAIIEPPDIAALAAKQIDSNA